MLHGCGKPPPPPNKEPDSEPQLTVQLSANNFTVWVHSPRLHGVIFFHIWNKSVTTKNILEAFVVGKSDGQEEI